MSASAKPTLLTLIPENVPAELTGVDHWTVSQLEWRDSKKGRPGKWHKVPHIADRPDKRASSTNPGTWRSFATALATYSSGLAAAVGFVLFSNGDAEGGIVGADLDGCVDPITGVIAPWALAIMWALRSYTEISPSGTGLRIFCHGRLPGGGRNRKGPFRELIPAGAAIEVYDHAKVLTVTGHHVEGTPTGLDAGGDALRELYDSLAPEREEPAEGESAARRRPPIGDRFTDDEILERVRRSKGGAEFRQLFDEGDWESGGRWPSQSEADWRLINTLYWWVGDDPERVEALFRRSALYRAEKDDDGYIERTVANAQVPHGYGDPDKLIGWNPGGPDVEVDMDAEPEDVEPDEEPEGAWHDDGRGDGDPEPPDPEPPDEEGAEAPWPQPWPKEAEPRHKDKSYRILNRAEQDARPGLVYLVQDTLVQNTLACIWGPEGSCKSFHALDLAASISCGIPWCHCAVLKPGPVIYVAAEGGYDFKNRRQAWERHHRLETPNLYLADEGLNMLEPKDVGTLITSLLKRGIWPVAAFIDTVARTLVGKESDSEDMGRYVAAADRLIRAFSCTTAVVHHSGYDQSHERGSTALRAAVETSILVKQPQDGVVTVEGSRQKNDVPFGRLTFTRTSIVLGVNEQTGRDITSCVLVPREGMSDAGEPQFSAKAMQALQALATFGVGGEVSLKEWRAKSGLLKDTLDRVSEDLVERGYVRYVRRGVYAMHPKGWTIPGVEPPKEEEGPAPEPPKPGTELGVEARHALHVLARFGTKGATREEWLEASDLLRRVFDTARQQLVLGRYAAGTERSRKKDAVVWYSITEKGRTVEP
jgi:putative DNA primase/helicase